MSTEKTPIKTTPVGRLVQGDAFVPQTKDASGNPLLIKRGPNAGQPRVDYFMALAVPKTDPGVVGLIQTIHAEAQRTFPTMFDAQGNCLRPDFAFKYTDGDSAVPNTKGVPPNTREGFPGHYVFNFSGGYAPKCYTTGGAAIITDPQQIKRGYYIRINGSVAGNGDTTKPGVFLNHSMVEYVAYGEEIVSGPDGATVFGGSPVVGALPAGASATPLTPEAPLAPQGAVAAPVAAPIAAPVAAPVAAVAAPVAAPVVTPAPDFLNAPPPPSAAATPPPPPPAEQGYLHLGVSYTMAQLIAGGWTEGAIATLERG